MDFFLKCPSSFYNRPLNSVWQTVRNQYTISGKFDKKESMNAIVSGLISVTAWGKMFKSEVWDGITFPVGHVYEDLYRIFDVCERVSTSYIMNDVLIIHRIRESSITNTPSLSNLQDYFLAHERYSEYVKMHAPLYFTKETVRKVQSPDMRTLISYVGKSKTGEERKTIIAFISTYLKKSRMNADYEIGKATKIRLWVLQHCPKYLGMFYRAYRFIRSEARKMNGLGI